MISMLGLSPDPPVFFFLFFFVVYMEGVACHVYLTQSGDEAMLLIDLQVLNSSTVCGVSWQTQELVRLSATKS